MFLLVSVRHVGAHPNELQHDGSIQSSINLGTTFSQISRIRIIPSTQILATVFVYLLPFISQILNVICRMVLIFFLFWSILNGVTLKTNRAHWGKFSVRKKLPRCKPPWVTLSIWKEVKDRRPARTPNVFFVDTKTHYKPTETFQYTHFTSCHPPGREGGAMWQ